MGFTVSGMYDAYPDGTPAALTVYCDQESAGGGWTRVLQGPGNFNGSAFYLSGTKAIVADSEKMLFAFVNTLTMELSNAWYFNTPEEFRDATPLDAPGCQYKLISTTRVSDGFNVQELLRYGKGNYGQTPGCDDGCQLPPAFPEVGQLCLKDNPNPGTVGGMADFPSFSYFANSNPDYCAGSDPSFFSEYCSPTRQFIIFVR